MAGRASYLARLRREEDGGPTIEFLVVAMALFGLLFFMLESGLFMVRSVMLERGLDIAVREVRLGRIGVDDETALKRSVCDGAFLIGDCVASINIEMHPVAGNDPSSGVGAFLKDVDALPAAQCRDANNAPPAPNVFNAGGPHSIVLVRACLLVDPLFPGTGLGAGLIERSDRDGSVYALVKTTAFMREPR
ncbi:MAG: TadE/TadG family type IV pilus assembly protein [Paracoccaceae bacterium]